ncbi:MAG: hypothetical protein HY921_07080 [Elusimicrobia bacterium]|nr:hypothetical protein [Elusimicrobiota bacterium]
MAILALIFALLAPFSPALRAKGLDIPADDPRFAVLRYDSVLRLLEDPSLRLKMSQAKEVLSRSDIGREKLAVLARLQERGGSLFTGDESGGGAMAAALLGQHISVQPDFMRESSPEDIAAMLVHELTHIEQAKRGLPATLDSEEEAFASSAMFWIEAGCPATRNKSVATVASQWSAGQYLLDKAVELSYTLPSPGNAKAVYSATLEYRRSHADPVPPVSARQRDLYRADALSRAALAIKRAELAEILRLPDAPQLLSGQIRDLRRDIQDLESAQLPGAASIRGQAAASLGQDHFLRHYELSQRYDALVRLLVVSNTWRERAEKFRLAHLEEVRRCAARFAVPAGGSGP